MPTLARVAGGSSPRRVSHARARMLDRYTKSESPGDWGNQDRYSSSGGSSSREYRSKAPSTTPANRSASAGEEAATSGGTTYRYRPPGRSSYGTYRVDCSRDAASRPHSSTSAGGWGAGPPARSPPPSCATESSPYSTNTRWYRSSARRTPTS